MRVLCVVSFSSRDFTASEGDEFELPEGVDWLQAGFVVPLKEQKIETATAKPKERAAIRTGKPK